MTESARSGTAVQGLFYNDSVEYQHFREKVKQSYKKGSLETVISTLQNFVERQENDEIKGIYGSDPYSLSKQYSRCGRKLSQSNDEDYFLIRSNSPTTFLVNGEDTTKFGPQYVYFNQKCLKEYLHRKHNVQVEEFPYEHIIIDTETLNTLTDEECACLSSYGLHIQ